jgi:hypothetical protein
MVKWIDFHILGDKIGAPFNQRFVPLSGFVLRLENQETQ